MARSETGKLLREYGAAVFISVLVALVIRAFGIEAYRIPLPTMRPTLEPGDTIFVAKWPFGLRLPYSKKRLTEGRLPRYGEVVVYERTQGAEREFIKRVVALPGDKASIRNGRLTLNGKPMTGNWSASCGPESVGQATYTVCIEPPIASDLDPIEIPPGQVLLLADLRSRPSDPRADAHRKRAWEIVPVTALRGSALFIWLSISPEGASRAFPRIRFERMFREIQ